MYGGYLRTGCTVTYCCRIAPIGCDSMTLIAAQYILHVAIDNGAPSNAPFVIYTDEQGQVFMLFNIM